MFLKDAATSAESFCSDTSRTYSAHRRSRSKDRTGDRENRFDRNWNSRIARSEIAPRKRRQLDTASTADTFYGPPGVANFSWDDVQNAFTSRKVGFLALEPFVPQSLFNAMNPRATQRH